MLLAIISGLLLAAAYILLRLLRRRGDRRSRRQRSRYPLAPSHTAFVPPKPPWVRREILRLKALLPDQGCRKIAHTFNHLHARRGETVGKTFVASVLKGQEQEILRLRRGLKHRRPRRVPRTAQRAQRLPLACVAHRRTTGDSAAPSVRALPCPFDRSRPRML